eukprot:UN34586
MGIILNSINISHAKAPSFFDHLKNQNRPVSEMTERENFLSVSLTALVCIPTYDFLYKQPKID